MDEHLTHLNEHGYLIAPGLVPLAEVEAVQADLFELFPSPEALARGDKGSGPLADGAFGGLVNFPFAGDSLHRLIVHPALLQLAEKTLETTDLRIHQAALWAKYAGASDYDQSLHADYVNHTLVVPSDDPGVRQLITWILLSDVTPDQGATRIVSRRDSAPLPPGVYTREQHPALYAAEVPAAGPAGTVFAYGPDVLHRGAAFTAPTGGRFTLTVSFRSAGADWAGITAWPGHGLDPQMSRFLTTCTPRERDLFGFPSVDHPYWTAATLDGVARRYPEMDMSPYTPR